MEKPEIMTNADTMRPAIPSIWTGRKCSMRMTAMVTDVTMQSFRASVEVAVRSCEPMRVPIFR